MTVYVVESEYHTVRVEHAAGWYEVYGPEGRVTRLRSLARAERCARAVARMLP
jgi:hypothetical protein